MMSRSIMEMAWTRTPLWALPDHLTQPLSLSAYVPKGILKKYLLRLLAPVSIRITSWLDCVVSFCLCSGLKAH